MSGDDETKSGGRLLSFPRVSLPGSFDAPGPDPQQPAEDEPPDRQPGVWPSMAGVGDMAPPLALTMPGIPDAGDNDTADEDGAFVPPAPEDPANPTARDMLAVCMALVTAMGTAAALGMWHRARRRSALADQARASADKATQKAAGGKAAKGSKGSEGSPLLSPGRKRPGGGGGKGGRDRPAGHGKGPSGPGKGPGSRKDRPGGKAPKAERGGKPSWADKVKRRKRKPPKGGAKPPKPAAAPKTPKNSAPKTPKKPGGKLRWKARKPGKGGPAKRKGWTSGRPKGAGKGLQKPKASRPGKLSWKAPKRKPGPGGGKAIAGRKRWGGRGRFKPVVKRRRKSWTRRARKTGARWLKRWKTRRRTTTTRQRTFGWFTWPKRGRGKHRTRRSWGWSTGRRGAGPAGAHVPGGTTPPPPPPPGFGGMRPPPGADRRVRVSAERVYPDAEARQEEPQPAGLVLAGAPPGGRRALPAASTTPSTPSATPNGARTVMSAPVRTTQYRDAELTIYDIVDADADMAEEITAGVPEARATADGCEQLLTRLETVHAKIIELQVPGLLAGWLVRIIEKTGTVQARALAIAAQLPAASEAISIAGSNAAARHQRPADVTRDQGHIRPAEKDYHNE
ncbi:hypothetical protein GCM10022419_034120 [Nonomuraea rosea]|uniref:Uncharacterized protein n=1 Tax=Nonomuraea rosea TaxID=638574 RepID=A0ABP6WFF3_9ACTN